MRAFVLAVAALLLCASPGRGAGLRVPLAIDEPAGIARDAAPVTVGVPLPAGRVRAAGALWVAAPDGRATPAQAHVLERWPDGSARWVLVDFLATVGAHASATFTLRDGRPAATPRPAAIRMRTDGDAIVLATGAADFVVPASGGSIVREVRIGGETLGARVAVPIPVVDTTPRVGVRESRTSVETEGPIRTELLLAGRYESDLAYEARVAAFAGAPWLRVQLTVTNLASRPYTGVRGLPLTVAPPRRVFADRPDPFLRGAVGVGAAVRAFQDLERGHLLRQPDAGAAVLDGALVGQPGDGWARATRDDVSVTLVRRYFREEWPQSLGVAGAALTADLLGGGDEPVELGIGAAKTFELWLVFERSAAAGDPARLAASFQRPLLAHVDPEWVVRSRALPNAIARDTPGAAELLPRLATAIGRYLARNRAERWDDGPPVPCERRTAEHERTGAYGALNWGDWNFPGYRDRSKGCDAWGNLEYDLPQVLGLAWAATGDPVHWDAFVAATRHYRDVDIIHFAPGHEDIVGINHPHKMRHFAVESPQTIDLGHTWLEGLVTHYRLTGEVRSLEAARGIADVLVRRQSKAGNPRQYGWPMIALAAAYDATGEARYRGSAAAYADAAVVAHQPTPAAGDWKMGILADGIAAVHHVTGDERLRRWLLAYADAYAGVPDPPEDPRYALPLGYLAALTQNARYRTLALATADRMPIGDWGKTLAISGRTAFRLLGGLAASPPKPGPAAPRPASARGRRRR